MSKPGGSSSRSQSRSAPAAKRSLSGANRNLSPSPHPGKGLRSGRDRSPTAPTIKTPLPRKTSPAPESAVLLVDCLSRNITEPHLKQLFRHFGEVVNVEVSVAPTDELPQGEEGTGEEISMEDRERSGQGHGFVEFKKRADAVKALHQMHGSQIDGNVVELRFAPARPWPPRQCPLRTPPSPTPNPPPPPPPPLPSQHARSNSKSISPHRSSSRRRSMHPKRRPSPPTPRHHARSPRRRVRSPSKSVSPRSPLRLPPSPPSRHQAHSPPRQHARSHQTHSPPRQHTRSHSRSMSPKSPSHRRSVRSLRRPSPRHPHHHVCSPHRHVRSPSKSVSPRRTDRRTGESSSSLRSHWRS